MVRIKMRKKLQIFVSSTFTDLIPERQAAVSAILKAGHIPAGMELFTAADRSQMATIKNWIDESDVYMLILGGRYGSIEAESGKSYTELEYDYAVSTEKPLFAVVIKEEALNLKVKEKGIEVFEQISPKELASFRGKVLSNISSFFSDEKDIKLCVHESLSDFTASRNLKGWVSGSEVIDSQALASEIHKLQTENIELRAKLLSAETAITSKGGITDQTFEELKKLLRSQKVTVPEAIANGKESYELDLLTILVSNISRGTLINGVTNSSSRSPIVDFYYFKVFPLLKVYGLSENEKIASVQHRRSFLTKKGLDFIAKYDASQLK